MLSGVEVRKSYMMKHFNTCVIMEMTVASLGELQMYINKLLISTITACLE